MELGSAFLDLLFKWLVLNGNCSMKILTFRELEPTTGFGATVFLRSTIRASRVKNPSFSMLDGTRR